MHMSIRRAFALAALVAVIPATAHAQFERNTKLGVFAGATIPTGSTGDGAATGFNLGALIEMKPAASPVGIRFDGMYNRMGFDNGGGNSTIWSLNGNAVLSPTASPVYLIGGLGLYSMKDNFDTTIGGGATESGTKLGFNVGAGLRIPLTGFDTFIEGRWHSVDAGEGFDRVTFIPISFGVRF